MSQVAIGFYYLAVVAWSLGWAFSLVVGHLTLVDAAVQEALHRLSGLNGAMDVMVRADMRRAYVHIAVSLTGLFVGLWSQGPTPATVRPLTLQAAAVTLALVAFAWAWAAMAYLDRRARAQALGIVKRELAASMRAKESA